MKFLLDENVPYSLYKFLRGQGHDVLRAQDIRQGMPDTELLNVAERDNRIIVTLDKDFGRLYLTKPRTTIVLIDVHPPYPEKVVSAFSSLLKRPALLEAPGLVVVTPTSIRRIQI